MTKELSYVDISRIHSYVEGMGVEFYDVQVEIVDHIASVMEEQMNMNPDKPFKEIFDTTLSKFTDFDGLVNEKRRQVARQYNRYVFQSLKSFFNLPKIIFTVLLAWLSYLFLNKATGQTLALLKESVFWISIIGTIGYVLFVHWRNNVQYHRLSATSHIAWMPLFTQIPQFLVVLTRCATGYPNQYTLLFFLAYCTSFLLIWATIESYEKLRAYGREKYLKALA